MKMKCSIMIQVFTIILLFLNFASFLSFSYTEISFHYLKELCFYTINTYTLAVNSGEIIVSEN